MKEPVEFKIPPAPWPEAEKAIEALANQVAATRADKGDEFRYAVPPNVIRAMADIATNVWKAKSKMLDSGSGEVREEMKRVYRHIEGALESFEEIDLEVKDHTGDAFDYGLPLKVITTQPTNGITKESVIETIKPTIYWQNQIIQMGEVVIATPASPNPIL